MADMKSLIQFGTEKCKKLLQSLGLTGSIVDVQMYALPDRKGKTMFGYTFHFPKSNAEIRFLAPSRTPNMVYAFEFGKIGADMAGQVDLNSEDAGKILTWAVNTKYGAKKATVSEARFHEGYKDRIKLMVRIAGGFEEEIDWNSEYVLKEGEGFQRRLAAIKNLIKNGKLAQWVGKYQKDNPDSARKFTPEDAERVIKGWVNNPSKNTKEKIASILPNFKYIYMIFLADTKYYGIDQEMFATVLQRVIDSDPEFKRIAQSIRSKVAGSAVDKLMQNRDEFIKKYGADAYKQALGQAYKDAQGSNETSSGNPTPSSTTTTEFQPKPEDIQPPTGAQKVSSADMQDIVSSLTKNNPRGGEGKTWERKYNKLLDDVDMLLTDDAVKGMFLYGPPGTGKTHDIQNMVSEIIHLLEQKSGEKFVVAYEMASTIDSEKALYQFFKNTEGADIVIFDEADKILQRANFANIWKAALGDADSREVVIHTKEGSMRVTVKAKFIFISNTKNVNDAVKSRLAFTSYDFTLPEIIRKFKDTLNPEKLGVDKTTLFKIIDALAKLTNGDASKINYRILSRSIKYFKRDPNTWKAKAREEMNGAE